MITSEPAKPRPKSIVHIGLRCPEELVEMIDWHLNLYPPDKRPSRSDFIKNVIEDSFNVMLGRSLSCYTLYHIRKTIDSNSCITISPSVEHDSQPNGAEDAGTVLSSTK